MPEMSSPTRSWIDPEVHWRDEPSIFVVRLPLAACDQQVLEFCADGKTEIPRSLGARQLRALGGDESRFERLAAWFLWGRLTIAAPDSEGPEGTSERQWVYLRDLYRLPATDEIALVVGTEPAPADRERFSLGEDAKAAVGAGVSNGSVRELLLSLPVGIVVASNPEQDPEWREYSADAIALSGIEPPRDGRYEGLVAAAVCYGTEGSVVACDQQDEIPPAWNGHAIRECVRLVTWTPGNKDSPYPEIRSAIRQVLPRAFERPHRRGWARPASYEIALEDRSGESLTRVEIVGKLNLDELGPLDHLRLPSDDVADRAVAGRNSIRRGGIEAIAWYQPFHRYDEGSWGVYLDAPRLDEITHCLRDDLRTAGVASAGHAAAIALLLVMDHELFHGRVEAALSWIELQALRPRFLRYSEKVYQAQAFTTEWREEALANWWGMQELTASLQSSSGLAPRSAGIRTVVEDLLDLSPAGYCNWRDGFRTETWRKFSSELCTAIPGKTFRGKALPLESIVRGPLPFDFRADDIPTYVVGRGIVAEALLSSPATFSTPSRLELARVLRTHFRYEVEKGRGNGSHQLWKGPDNRQFPLPRRDPVSLDVFRTFLHHFQITKADYVLRIRRGV